MTDILVRPAPTTEVIAADLARSLRLGTRYTPKDASDAEFLDALDDPDVLMGVVGFDDDVWWLLQHARDPLVLVPAVVTPRPGGTPGSIERVLLPLDGTEEAARAVAETAGLFHTAGIELVLLHVFDEHTVPACWDQSAHAREAWETEFRARFCRPLVPHPHPEITLCSGEPGEHVVEVAAREADLVVLGWSRRLAPDHARTVRAAVDAAAVPVMVIPVRARLCSVISDSAAAGE
ncbi:universal stress protein [Nocardia otitidiscaviarum]|uniref:universal stress protein n=1 Tax=Nocardia otitidiscaviarum TaxID=1823 RepID=UPI001895FD48|nr:universal stress protein [Nocardia otitidiscaviarum]MBF6180002.1 universal stress protein [Nocardia otitidiscaviarum]